MSPFRSPTPSGQGSKGVGGTFTQGVALGYIMAPFQGYRRLRTIFIAYG